MKYKNKAVILTIILVFLAFTPALTYGYELLAPLPGTPPTEQTQLSSYFAALFRFAIVVASILAVIVIIIAGLKYIGAAGNPAVINDAKDQIYWAILGLILALSSWMILNIINPKLLELKLGVSETEKISAPDLNGVLTGDYCKQFTENNVCNADNNCIWNLNNNSCAQKTCGEYFQQNACANNLACGWDVTISKCVVGKTTAISCNSLDQATCQNNEYCAWWNYPGACNTLKKVKCEYYSAALKTKTTLNCETGPKCGLSATNVLCCVGSAPTCSASSVPTTTPQ